MRGRNYITLRGGICGFIEFMFVDTSDYLGDECLIAEQIRGDFRDKEFVHENFPGYRLIFCKVRTKNIEKMKSAMDRLWDRMLLLGHEDYPEVCHRIFEIFCRDESFSRAYGK